VGAGISLSERAGHQRRAALRQVTKIGSPRRK
jgi:hypothetical protein